MKQKLLNSFTWRASLLVAFLCCAFSSAWGRDYEVSKPDIFTSISVPGEFTADVTGYFKQISVNATVGGSTRATFSLYVVDDEEDKLIGSVTVSKSSGSASSNKLSDENAIFGKKIKLKITKSGNQSVTKVSVTVTYTPAATFEINEACLYKGNYYGTYSNSQPFDIPTSGLTVSEVSVSDGTLEVAPLSGTVPANTGVLVSSTTAGEKIVKLNNPAGPYTAPSNNMLHPSSEEMTSIKDYSDYYFYHLTFNDSNPLGFYWGYPGGGAWEFSGSNKAYLAVPKTDSGYSVKGFTMSDSADGIKAIETEKNSEVVFNLAGQRVSKMQKGIYVVNGKKILVK